MAHPFGPFTGKASIVVFRLINYSGIPGDDCCMIENFHNNKL